ncbi:MAG: ATP-dependent sacrificial sulfur transferase LarE [Phascolarctobacterium sp.]|nr:ATP-dependent sacrificial sulfur transferase LarE [Phascolarctobacterium sp.]
MEATLLMKETALLKFLQQLPKPALAFSGGVDSALLLAACKIAKVPVKAITAVTPLVPAFEREDALRIAKEWNAEQSLLNLNPLTLPEFCANESKRCYHCKKLLFAAILTEAKRLGCSCLLDGANLDDTGDYRPGMQATKELHVISPLLECGFTKADVRALAKRYKLSVAGKPAYACLASRIAYGEVITLEKLASVEQAEEKLKSLGLTDVRVRCHNNIARIEVAPQQIELAATKLKDEIVSSVKAAGFSYATLDLEGFRSGSMNVNVK